MSELNLRCGWLPGDGRPAVIAHGGAWDIPFDETASHVHGLGGAVKRGSQILLAGDSALDAVTETVSWLEDYPAFDAGVGSVLNQAGAVELDAGIMCGEALSFGAVACVSRIKNPIRGARRLLNLDDGQKRLLAGSGADLWAHQNGLPCVPNDHFVVPREQRRFDHLHAEQAGFHTSRSFSGLISASPGDTVGCVALDAHGKLACGTSTGGAPFTVPGRVGDSPLPGSGYYANSDAAASATGWGEAISAYVLCVRVVDDISSGMPVHDAILKHLKRLFHACKNPSGEGGTCGIIVLDANGNAGWGYTTPRMARAGWSTGRSQWTGV